MKYAFRLFVVVVLTIVANASFAQEQLTPQKKKQLYAEAQKKAKLLNVYVRDGDDSALYTQYTLDTFTINEFERRCMDIESSTLAMMEISYDVDSLYDKLLNSYYKKLLNKLTTKDKPVLIEAQKAWLAYREKELKLLRKLTEDKYSGGGSIQGIIYANNKSNLLRKRVQELFDMLAGGM